MFQERQDDALSKTKARALKILGSRQLSSHDILRRLIQKGETEENAGETVLWLERIGAVNDAAYADSICRYYADKGYGLSRIKDELYKRGISRELWDDAISSIDDSDARDAVLRFLDKKLKGSTDEENIRRASGTLRRRGLSYEDVKNAIAEYTERTENMEDC